MKFADLSPCAKRALSLTGKRVDDADWCAPTWRGQRWHLARLSTEEQVLHEVAHWLVATPAHRVLQNYGLGIDPYGGQLVHRYLHGDSGDWLESVASFLTRHLLRYAAPRRARGANHLVSQPASAGIAARQVAAPSPCIAHLAALGIDLADPLRRFEAAASIDTHGGAEEASCSTSSRRRARSRQGSTCSVRARDPSLVREPRLSELLRHQGQERTEVRRMGMKRHSSRQSGGVP